MEVAEIFPEDFEPSGEHADRLRRTLADMAKQVMHRVIASQPVSTERDPIRAGWRIDVESEPAKCRRCEAQLSLEDCGCGACIHCHEVLVGADGMVARCPVHA